MSATKVNTAQYVLEFRLEGLPKTANGSHGHWRAKFAHTKRWKQAVFLKAWPFKPPEPLLAARLTLIRCSSRESDFDGLVHSFKPIVDGLRQSGIIVDDRKANIGQPQYLWEYAKPGRGHIKVRVEAV